MGGDVVVVMCGAVLSGPGPAIEGLLAVDGWYGGGVSGDGVVGGGDRRVVMWGCCVVPIRVICFRRLQAW